MPPIAPVRAPVASRPRPSSSVALRQGSRGPAVAQLQRSLATAGFNPGSADGVFGPRTSEAVIRFQASRGLRRDGVAGPDTLAALRPTATAPITAPASSALTAPASSALRSRILDLARAEIGTRERGGDNRGDVQKYQRFFGRGVEPYCADFLSYVVTKAGKPLNFAYTPYLERHLKETGAWKGRSNPQPGDVVMFDINGDGKADHTGFVETVNADGTVTTIEGNTTHPDGGNEGVWRKRRQMSVIRGFANP